MKTKNNFVKFLLFVVLFSFVITGCGESNLQSGNIWTVNSGEPMGTVSGSNGDMYLDTLTYNLYQMKDNNWVKVGNISGKDGSDGIDGKNGENGKDGINGTNAVSPTIEINTEGYWVINGKTTNVKAVGKDGKDGIDGVDGIDGDDAVSPTVEINSEGYWVISGKTTNVKAAGQDGIDGKTPTIEISDDDYWVINGVKTNVDAGKRSICKAVTTSTKTTGNVPEGNFEAGDEYICKVKEGLSYRFFVLNKDENAGKVNLIMERDIASDGSITKSVIRKEAAKDGVYTVVPWITEEDYNKANTDNTECAYPACNDEGPVTALNYLYEATKDWTNLDKIEGNVYTRLPISKEIPVFNGTNLWLYNYLSADTSAIPVVTGTGLQNIPGVTGYWTSSIASGLAHRVTFIAHYGKADWTNNQQGTLVNMAVRPVISIYMTHMD